MTDPIKLLIVDDSMMMRQVLSRIFDAAPHIQVAGEASNGKEALELIPKIKPDVISLDINMPVMDGLTALKHIMIRFPRPTVMCSTLTREGEGVTFDALKFGAVDFIYKPSNRHTDALEEQYLTIIRKVTLASQIDMDAVRLLRRKKKIQAPAGEYSKGNPPKSLCIIGASEGGYGALLKILPYLRADSPTAYIVIIHDAPRNVDAFTRYIKDDSVLRIERASNGMQLESGVCVLSSGEDYLTLQEDPDGFLIRLHPAPFPDRRGSIDMTLFSAAELFKDNCTGIILSGSGKDGVEGICELSRMGGLPLVQAPDSCLHKEASLAVKEVLPGAHFYYDREMADAVNKQLVHSEQLRTDKVYR